jgi:hypothetical protein
MTMVVCSIQTAIFSYKMVLVSRETTQFTVDLSINLGDQELRYVNQETIFTI